MLGRPLAADIDLTTDARPEQTTELVARLGRRGLGPGRPLRHRRAEEGRHGVRDHHPPRRGLRARLAQARRVLRRRGRGRPGAPRLHRQRHGAARHGRGRRGARAHRSRSAASPTWRPACCARRCRRRCPSPTTRCACCGRRASSPATASCPTTALRRGRARAGRAARDRVGRADPRRARASCSSSTTRPPGCGSSSTPGSPTSSSPSCPAMRVEQDPIHRHKDVLAHTIAVVAKTRPTLVVRMAALLHDVGKPKTRSIGPQGRVVPPPRGGRRPHGPRPAARPALPERAGRRHQPARLPPPALPRLRRRRVDRQRRAPLRARRRPPARRAQRAHPLRLHDPQRAQGRACWRDRMDALEARIAELREREELAAIRPDLDGER